MRDLAPPARRRLTSGLLLSLAIHAILLNLVFGGQGLGLPGFSLPWQNRRIEVPDVHAILLPAPLPAALPLLKADIEPLADVGRTVMTLVHFTPPPKVSAAPNEPQATLEKVLRAETVGVYPSASAISPLPAERPNEKKLPPPKSTEDLIAVAKSDKSTWTVPLAPELAAPATVGVLPALLDAAEAKQDAQRQAEKAEAERQEAAKQAATQQEAARQEVARVEAARIEAERHEVANQAVARQAAARQLALFQEAARAEIARAEAERQETIQRAATQQETARQEAVRVEVERQEVSRQEAARQAAVRQEAVRQEAVRQEAVRQEAVRQEAVRQEAVRQEAVRQEAVRQEATRQEAIRVEATRLAALQAEAEKRQEKLLAIGRQLNEEAARREAAVAQRQLPSASSARRGRLLGRTDPNADLILYAEAWSRKIQLNMTFDMVREAAKQPHTDPMVTVAVRSDGSVESVTFVVSSGVPAIDEAIRRIVYSQANYEAFPPRLVREFDVIEIRRTWYFDMAVRLY